MREYAVVLKGGFIQDLRADGNQVLRAIQGLSNPRWMPISREHATWKEFTGQFADLMPGAEDGLLLGIRRILQVALELIEVK